MYYYFYVVYIWLFICFLYSEMIIYDYNHYYGYAIVCSIIRYLLRSLNFGFVFYKDTGQTSKCLTPYIDSKTASNIITSTLHSKRDLYRNFMLFSNQIKSNLFETSCNMNQQTIVRTKKNVSTGHKGRINLH